MIERTLKNSILKLSKHFPVILLTGARQVGKTTFLENLLDNRKYVTLDDYEQRNLAQNDPQMFLQIHKPPIFIDEIQYAPKLFSYIKIYVDKNKENGAFWLSGSQKFHLMKNITETLAGRIAIIDMLGLSQYEIQNKVSYPFLPDKNWIEKISSVKPVEQDIMDIYENIFRGFYPKLIADKELPRNVFYSSYVQTYIERDVKDLTNIGNETKFLVFLKTIAARTGQLINYTDIANNVDVDVKTVQNWTSILEASGIIKMLYPYYTNISKRVIKTPKMYFLDTGLCSYLCGWDSAETLMNGSMSGNILETYVFGEILKSYYNNTKDLSIWFYRDKDQKEIDFIIETNDTLYPIEVKKTSSPSNAKLSFKVLNKLNKKVGLGAIICFYDSILPIDKNVVSIPVCYI